MKSKVFIHILLSLAAIGFKANGGASRKPSGVFTLLKEHLTAHAKSLNYQLDEFLSGGYYGDVFIASEITTPIEGGISENTKPAGKKFALKIVENSKTEELTVCEKYKQLKAIFSAGNEQILLPFKIDVMILDHSKINDEFLEEIHSFCFLSMDLGLQSFEEPIFKKIGLDESNKKLNQDVMVHFLDQMLLGMEALLRKGIIHEDFRDVNILLFSQSHLMPIFKQTFGFQAKLIDFDLIDFNKLKSLDKNDLKVKQILTDLIKKVISTFEKIINTNKEFLFDGEKGFPILNAKEIIEKDFPFFTELYKNVEITLTNALEDFFKGEGKKSLI